MKKITLITLLLALFGLAGNTQQISLNTLYIHNPYLINPASAGLKNCFSAYLDHRNQWTGINGSPVNNSLTLDGRLTGAHGIGVDVRMYSAGLLQNFSAKLTYAYHLKIADNANLSFGISLGLLQQRFNFSEAVVVDNTDNSLFNGTQSDMGFTTDAGLLFSTPRLRLGVAVPQVFTRGINLDYQNSTHEYKLVQHMRVHGSYDLIQREKWKLTPFALYRNAALIGHQTDIGARGAWKNTIGLGMLYRSNYGWAGLFDLNIKDKFKLAYSYGFGGANFTRLSNGSHEIMLGIQLCRRPPATPEEEPIVAIPPAAEDTTTTEPEIIETPGIIEEPIDTVVQEPEIIPAPEPVLLDLDSLNRAFRAKDRLILYDFNSATDVNSGNREKVADMVVTILQDNPDLTVNVIGHTCDIGTADENHEVALNRANNIRQKLINKGIDSKRITVTPMGEKDPLVPNNSEANRVQNRRVLLQFKRIE